MSHPKLNIRELRRHPAVITSPADLQPGKEVAIDYVMPPIGRRMRCGQALMGALVSRPDGQSRSRALREGYAFTPAWGIIMTQKGTVNWINTENPNRLHPYASFNVTHSTENLSHERILGNAATSMEVLAEHIRDIPRVHDRDNKPSALELVTSFDSLGLTFSDAPGYDKIVVDLGMLG